MNLYKDVDDKKKILLDFIKKHPNTTHREIKRALHLKVTKIYPTGLETAFKDAGIKSPRTFKRMSEEEKRKIIIEFIKKNPKAGGQTIRKETKIKLIPTFKNTEEAFVAAGVKYPRTKFNKLKRRTRDTRKKQIIEFLKKNPLENISIIGKKLRVHPYSIFSGTRELYLAAEVPYLSKHAKRRIKKQNAAIEFIKNNPYATQREINSKCKTKVQDIFDRGIFEAYERAKVDFPFERLNVHGVVIKQIKEDAIAFEEEIAKRLSCYGKVNRLVKTKNGIADIILERKNRTVAIEVKNYKVHEISLSQIKQLNKYLEAIDSNLGFLICLKKPKKDTFLMGKNKIIILQSEELDKIPKILDTDL